MDEYCIMLDLRYSIPYSHFMRTTQRKGDAAVAQSIATFTKLGYDVALPITESAAYDIILDDGAMLYRVQVRYSSSREIELRRIHTNSIGYVIKKTKMNAYDWLYVLNAAGEEFLMKKCFDGRRSVHTQPEFKINIDKLS